jgi:hypothetical protein
MSGPLTPGHDVDCQCAACIEEDMARQAAQADGRCIYCGHDPALPDCCPDVWWSQRND